MKCRKCGRRGRSYAGRVCTRCRNEQVVAQRRARWKREPRALAAHRARDRKRARAWWASIPEAHRERIRKKNRKRHREHGRRYELKKLYALTIEQWESAFRRQRRRCAICRSSEPGGKGWNTDHCHRTGRFRGILCCACNRGIGNLGDDPKRLAAAISYLSQHAS